MPKPGSSRYTGVLARNSDKEFVRRILDPSLNPDPVDIGGRPASHLMAAETDASGNWYVFPTVINAGGKLKHIPSHQSAMDHALSTGEFIFFGKDGDSALDFSKNYKTDEFKRYFDGEA